MADGDQDKTQAALPLGSETTVLPPASAPASAATPASTGGGNLAGSPTPGGAVGLEDQPTNNSLGVTDAITAQASGGTTGAEKSVVDLVPQRNPGESDADYAARLEAFRKRSADTAANQSPSNDPSPKYHSDADRLASASDEQKRAWADQKDPQGARLRAAGVDPNDPAALANAQAGQQTMSAKDRIAANAKLKDADDATKDRHTIYEEIKDDITALHEKIDQLGAAAAVKARHLLDEALAVLQQHV